MASNILLHGISSHSLPSGGVTPLSFGQWLGCHYRSAKYSTTFLPSLKDWVKGEIKANGDSSQGFFCQSWKGRWPLFGRGIMMLRISLSLGFLEEICLQQEKQPTHQEVETSGDDRWTKKRMWAIGSRHKNFRSHLWYPHSCSHLFDSVGWHKILPQTII